MTVKPRVLIPRKYRNDIATELPEFERVSGSVEFVPYHLINSDEFKKFLPESNIDALWITEEMFLYLDDVKTYLEYFPKSLKLILVPWVGTDFLDAKELKEKYGITLCNGGPLAAENVSDLAVFLTLSCFRMTSFWEHSFRYAHRGDISECREYIGGTRHVPVGGAKEIQNGIENSTEMFPNKANNKEFLDLVKQYRISGKLMESPTNKNALVLGFGSIGRAIGKKLHQTFNMHVSYTKRGGPVSESELGFKATYLPSMDHDEFWESADLIVLSLPGTPETKDIINKEVLAKCKDGVRIVNVGRGSCINEDDLLDALEDGKVASAGLDVFKNEFEQVNPRFFQRWDVTLLPHIGSTVVDILERQTKATLENIDGYFFKGTGPKYPVN